MTLNRIILSTFNAFFVSGALFAFMYSLIYMEEPQLLAKPKFVDFSLPQVRPDPKVDPIVVKPPKPILVNDLPDIPEPVFVHDPKIENLIGDPNDIYQPPKQEINPSADGQLTVAMMYPPAYPGTAASRGIEGYAIVEFSVSQSGEVFDARILESEPGSVFDRAALKAIYKFKYHPQKVNGKPVISHKQIYQFTFEMEKN